jgi:type IV pilus assembly protein PilM
MSRDIISLDLGSYSIKATVLRNRWGGFDLAGFYQKTVEHDESISDRECTALAVARLLAENKLRGEGVVLSMPGLVVSTRLVMLPFTDRKKIARVIPFEVEGFIPFGIEEVVVSYHIVGQEEGKTRALAIALRKDLLRENLEALAKVGVVPRIVDVDFMALFNLSQGGLKEAMGCYAMVDIGEAKTSICIVHDRRLGFGRSIPIAGRAITQAIEKEFSLSQEEAERLKEAEGFVPLASEDSLEPERQRMGRVVESAVVPLVQEIGRTFYAFEAEVQKKVERVFLCGGTSQLDNLTGYLSEKTGLPVDPLPLIPSDGDAWSPQERAVMPQAYGLGVRAVSDGRCSQINFLKDEFAYRTEIRGMRGKLVYVGVALAVILGLFVFDGVTRYTEKEKQYTELRQEIRRVFKETFPEVKQIVSERQQMKTRILELQREVQTLASLGGAPVTVLDLIREVTERTPPGVEVDIDGFSVDAEKVRLSGRTDSFESVDRIVKALGQFELFEDVSLSNAKVDAKDNKVDFKVSISLRPS